MDLLSKLLKKMVSIKASDLYLSTGQKPAFRVNGRLQACDVPPLTPGSTQKMAQLIMQGDEAAAFLENPETNVAYSVPNIGRFRFNIFRQRNETAMVIRAIQEEVPDFEQLGIPDLLKDVVMLKRGLVLVVGPSGAGKSTTLAAMIDYRNQHEMSHIITIEDPIEYIINHKRSIVNQREVGVDTVSYHHALTNALRQSPDVIMVGEIRDSKIMSDVIEFSDTGHLVLATLHANNASQAMERIVHMFPKDKHDQMCSALATNIKAIISQILVPTVYGAQCVATEMLVVTPRVADLIRRGKINEVQDVMEKDTNSGMHTMDQSLYQLYCDERISEETALSYADSVSNMRLQIRLSAPSTSQHEISKSS